MTTQEAIQELDKLDPTRSWSVTQEEWVHRDSPKDQPRFRTYYSVGMHPGVHGSTCEVDTHIDSLEAAIEKARQWVAQAQTQAAA